MAYLNAYKSPYSILKYFSSVTKKFIDLLKAVYGKTRYGQSYYS